MDMLDWFLGKDGSERIKRIFISFAMEDVKYRNHLVTQAKNSRSPFEFIDMSAKKPWKQEEWQKRCRTKIRRSDGMIALLSKNMWHASGARWEMRCAIEEKKPIIGMHIKKDQRGAIPSELAGKRVITWSWPNLERFIDSIRV